MQALIAEIGLASRIHMLGFRNDVASILAGSDIFALATQKEASGTVYVEASAAGLPVIGVDVGGVSEMVSDGEAGILVPPGDIGKLRQALASLIDDGELRARMGQAGKRMVYAEGKFSLAGLAQRTEQVYETWLAERGSPGPAALQQSS
ncbi:Alpha-D-kanosaminyltransferase [compost metagenome]